MRGKQRLRVTAEAERGVDDGGGPVRDRRCEQRQYPLQQHRHVLGWRWRYRLRRWSIARTDLATGGGVVRSVHRVLFR